jgi:hypothetical protein
LRRHRLAALNVLSVALGVAVYLATQIANHSNGRSPPRSTWWPVKGVANGAIQHLPETVFHAAAARASLPRRRSSEVRRCRISRVNIWKSSIDIFTNALRTRADRFRLKFDSNDGFGPAPSRSTKNSLRANLKAGDRIRAQVNVVDLELQVGFILGSEGLIPILQRWILGGRRKLGRRGELSAIQLRLTNPREREKSTELRKSAEGCGVAARPADRGGIRCLQRS